VVDAILMKPSPQSPINPGSNAAAFPRQRTSVPVSVTGVGFFDVVHGQMGMAPNGLELHPVLKIVAAGP
jgi:hypothetical protein